MLAVWAVFLEWGIYSIVLCVIGRLNVKSVVALWLGYFVISSCDAVWANAREDYVGVYRDIIRLCVLCGEVLGGAT